MSDVKTSLDALVASAANPIEPVKISGSEVSIRGVSIMEFIAVLRRFSKIQNTILGLIGATAADEDSETDTARDFAEIVLDFGPEAVAALVAAGMGKANGAPTAGEVLHLGDDDLIMLLSAVAERTMPGGMSDFFGRFSALAEKMSLGRPL